jgi:hypothetical protein
MCWVIAVQGETGSKMVLQDAIRVKPACQLAADVFKAAQSFQRISPAFPVNSVRLLPKFCFFAALNSPEPQQQCFTDALQLEHFSLLAAYNDPDKGTQYPGYVLYHDNVTRVCLNTVTQQCLQESNGDEELCMSMIVAASGIIGQPTKQGQGQHGGFSWSPGTAAAIAIAGAMWAHSPPSQLLSQPFVLSSHAYFKVTQHPGHCVRWLAPMCRTKATISALC